MHLIKDSDAGHNQMRSSEPPENGSVRFLNSGRSRSGSRISRILLFYADGKDDLPNPYKEFVYDVF